MPHPNPNRQCDRHPWRRTMLPGLGKTQRWISGSDYMWLQYSSEHFIFMFVEQIWTDYQQFSSVLFCSVDLKRKNRWHQLANWTCSRKRLSGLHAPRVSAPNYVECLASPALHWSRIDLSYPSPCAMPSDRVTDGHRPSGPTEAQTHWAFTGCQLLRTFQVEDMPACLATSMKVHLRPL
jgi:hypothetical protein